MIVVILLLSIFVFRGPLGRILFIVISNWSHPLKIKVIVEKNKTTVA